MMAYRASVNSSTGKTPNTMTLGREAVLTMQALIGKPTLFNDDDTTGVDDYLSSLQTNMIKGTLCRKS